VVNDQEIIKTIGYITDNKYIASYHGVDVKRVIALRETLHERKAKVEKAIYVSSKSAPADMSNDSERKWNASAREGSAELLKALNKFFENRERRLREGGIA
jgi:hypothetical protein